MADKIKVAVLGSGVGSIATMFELTALPENREKYDITCYQMGWRCGGKGASGRNAAMGQRIEEHGLHIWFGFYDNAFKAMRAAYDELGRPPEAPLSTIEKAFTPHDYVVLMDKYKGGWRTPWVYTFPTNDGVAGKGGDLPSFWTMAYLAISGLALFIETVLINERQPCSTLDASKHEHRKEGWWEHVKDFVHTVDQRIHALEIVPAGLMLGGVAAVLQKLSSSPGSWESKLARRIELAICDMLAKYRAWLWDSYGCHIDDDPAREVLVIADATLTTMIGMMKDETRTKGIFSIDDVELTDWFVKHGANPVTLTCPLVRALYDNIFAYENGDRSKPNAAAGTSLLWLLRMILTYKGHLMYKMNAGMGDTIFTPFHQVLAKRGVKFRFFHCVTNLGLDANKSAVDTIDVMQQVDLTVDEYDPYVDVKGLPCWPNQPNWDQIRDGAQFQADGVNLEQVVTPYAGRKPKTLRRGTDFDIVVLGIPIATLPAITPELYNNAAKPAWKLMCDNVATVQTQAYQVWMNRNLASIGWIKGSNSPVLGTYIELIDTYADMSHLIPVEDQPASWNVQSIAYFCGAMPDTATQSDADTVAAKNSLDMLVNDMPRLWSNLRRDDGTLDWDLFVDPQNRKGAERFQAQFVRANWTGTERYTLSLAGATKYRLKTDASGYSNLYLAGDWTDNHFNSGCVEASVMSGMMASRAICGYPQKIVGESPDLWEGDR
jgi:uncharacterized protein with NAD-binding domain and iron-sulfur cluster